MPIRQTRETADFHRIIAESLTLAPVAIIVGAGWVNVGDEGSLSAILRDDERSLHAAREPGHLLYVLAFDV